MKKAEPQRRSMPLPHSNEAEMAVIGGLFFAPESVFELTDKLRPEYFHIDIHQKIIECVVELASDAIQPDIVKVGERLKIKAPDFNLANYEGLKNFLTYAVNPANLPHWIDEVRRYWELRQILEVCGDIFSRGKQVASVDIPNFLQEVETTFMQLAESRISSGLRTSAEICMDTVRHLESIIENPGSITGIPSGFVDLDNITAGFQRSDLIILAARPAMGKTSLALNFAANAAIGSGRQVAFFSLEMSSQQLMQRMLATAARIQAHSFRNGKMEAREFEKLYDAVREFQTDKLMIDDTPGLSILDLASRCRKMKRERGACDMIIVDYLQLMSAGSALGSGSSREREISYISMGLKSLAKELSCPVIALAQLNRGLEQRPDKRPRPSDLRESGSIEQDADQIMFVYRDEVYHKDSQDKGVAEIIIGKNRHGPTETVKLAFHSEFTAFHNLAKF